ncbi:MAG: HNH endonuclease [Treponema sp.]|nr:HNH endonuclease [Treponema sp.]
MQQEDSTKNVRLNEQFFFKNQSSGWNSKENLLPFKNLSDQDVITLVNHALLGNSKHATSYKYVFFKSILDNLFNVDLDSKSECFLNFDSISLRFAEIYWNLILRFKLKQMPENTNGKKSVIEKILFDFCDKYGYSTTETEFAFEGLKSEQQLELANNIKKSVVTKYVLGAFCADSQWQFYHFSKTQKWEGIYLNKDFFLTLAKYRSDFEKINYFEWIKYLESINKEEDSYQLASKLDKSTERKNLDSYRKALFEFGQETCFYCGKKLSRTAFGNAVDHFIPWSFVKDDKLWNFVLACPICNSRKSDKLASQVFLSNLRLRNEKLIGKIHPFVQKEFRSYTYSKLALMYSNAAFNGFESGWEPINLSHSFR